MKRHSSVIKPSERRPELSSVLSGNIDHKSVLTTGKEAKLLFKCLSSQKNPDKCVFSG